jgi:hypothetical protein
VTAPILVLAAFLAGCSQPPLSPTRTLEGDPMIVALPPGLTVVGGAELAALDRGGLASSFAAFAGVTPSEAPSLAGADAATLDRLVLGCGEHGCLALAEGDLGGVDWCTVAQSSAAEAPASELRCSAASEPGLDGSMPGGEPLALRQLSPTKLVLGDRAAVRAAYPLAGERAGAGFDPAALEGLVPQGTLWLAAHEPSRMALQAARRLEQHGSPQALSLASELRDAVACCSDRLEDIAAVALAVDDDGDDLSAVLRVTCRDAITARGVERVVEERLQRALDEGTPPWVAGLSSLELVRAGETVELRALGTRTDLEDLLSGQEVAP